MRLLVDSAFVIDYLNGTQEALDRWSRAFADGDDPVVNDIVVCEVRTGLKPWELADFTAFLEPIEFVKPPPEVALTAGRWRAEARARGVTLGLADALIAATAWLDGAAVLTRNVRDFALTPARIETY